MEQSLRVEGQVFGQVTHLDEGACCFFRLIRLAELARPFQLRICELELHIHHTGAEAKDLEIPRNGDHWPKPILRGSCRIFGLLPADIHQRACECRDLSQSQPSNRHRIVSTAKYQPAEPNTTNFMR